MIGSSFALGYDMIDREVSELKQSTATAAHPFLFSEQDMPMCSIVGNLAQVRSLRNVCALDGRKVTKQVELPDTDLNEVNGLLRYVYTHPLAIQAFGGYASCGASSEGVKDHIPLVAAGLDDAVKQRQGFLGWIVDILHGGGRKRLYVQDQVLHR